MPSPSLERRNRTATTDVLPLAAVAAALLVAAALWVAVAAGSAATGRAGPGNPLVLPILLVRGRLAWPGVVATVVLVAETVVLAAAGAAAAWWWRHRAARRSRVDDAAQHLARDQDLAELTPQAAAAKAARLRGLDPGAAGLDDPASHGMLIGVSVRSGTPIRSSWEDVTAQIWGPRRGKTTSQAIPAVLDAPGAVVATSNKPDLLAATWRPRQGKGELWVLDPQRLAGDGRPSFTYDPLSQVRSVTDAEALVGIFRAAATDADARRDAYFDTASDRLLANLLLAAARAGGPLTTVYEWLMDPGRAEPAEVLAAHGDDAAEMAVRAVMATPEKQREGVYGTAQTLVGFLADPARAAWVIPTPGLPPFDPDRFLASTDTLYLLSQEGPGSSAAIVGALTQAIIDAALRASAIAAHGRLEPPLSCVLDEAANVCRLPQLPNLYSHLGSRGVAVATFLQSYEQGVRVWGRTGMDTLWSAATVRVYGGGVADARWLDDLSRIIGEHEVLTYSTTISHDRRRSRSVGESRHRERTLDVAALATLPAERAIVLAAGAVPVLIRTIPWWHGPHADAIRESAAARWSERGIAGTSIIDPSPAVQP